MYNQKINTYLKIIFLISIVSLILAFFIEYVLGHLPCNLCLIERVPYGLAVILLILNYFFKKNEKFTILLLTLIFSFSFLISFYHLGIEQMRGRFMYKGDAIMRMMLVGLISLIISIYIVSLRTQIKSLTDSIILPLLNLDRGS